MLLLGAVRSAIVALLHIVSPSTVAWFVVSVVIDPIERLFIWRLGPHVSKECVEIVPPSIAHGDSATAPIFEMLVVRIKTAVLGVSPRFIFSFVNLRSPMLAEAFRDPFQPETAAAFDLPVPEVL